MQKNPVEQPDTKVKNHSECDNCHYNTDELISLHCSHAVCEECLKNWLLAAICRNQIQSVACCVEQCEQITHNPVPLALKLSNQRLLQQIKEELQSKIDRFKSGVMTCPSQSCDWLIDFQHQQQVIQDYQKQRNSPDERTRRLIDVSLLEYPFGVCRQCAHVFCVVCRQAHGFGICPLMPASADKGVIQVCLTRRCNR